MSEIKQASTTPQYIDVFLKKNMVKLIEIHDEGIKENTIGCLGLKCSQKENTMDVFFMTEELLLKQLEKASWENLKESIESKKLFLIQDIDINSMFLVYI